MLQHPHLPILQQRRQHSKFTMLCRITDQLASIPTATYITPPPRNTQHYILPYARTHVFKTTFFPITIKIWNNLQPAITYSTTIPHLRQALQSTPTSGRRGATRSAEDVWTHQASIITYNSNTTTTHQTIQPNTNTPNTKLVSSPSHHNHSLALTSYLFFLA